MVVIIAGVAALAASLFSWLVWRSRSSGSAVDPEVLKDLAVTKDHVQHLPELLRRESELSRTSLSQEMVTLRQEMREVLETSRKAQVDGTTVVTKAMADARLEQTAALATSRRTLDERVQALTVSMVAEQDKARATLTESLELLRRDNETKLEQMRATVQEKLDATLGERLDASFKVVSEQLENVHKGLGEMQTLAQGVGSLQRTLTNVKSRGVWGELQLDAVLSDLLTPEQYQRQCRVSPGASELADFAITMPGAEKGQPLYLALDSKFPMDVYERFVEAWEGGDRDVIKQASKALEDRVRSEAQSVGAKYVSPPHTTDFAVMYLPTEGLFAEVARNPGLLHDLRAKHRVVVAGPTTVTALLGSLSMGFRTLAIQERSSEVWRVLGQVKEEFMKSEAVWVKMVKQLETATKTADEAGIRHRAVVRKLRAVEVLETAPPDESVTSALLAADEGDDPVDPTS